MGQTGRERQEEERATWDRTSAAGGGEARSQGKLSGVWERQAAGRKKSPMGGNGIQEQETVWTPPPPLPQPAPWGRMGRGARGAVGRGPEYRFRGPHLLCSLQGEHGGVELDLPQLQPPPLFIPWPSPLGGQGCRHELSLLENPLREGVRGGGWIAQPLGHVVVRADPRALWIWGSPVRGGDGG